MVYRQDVNMQPPTTHAWLIEHGPRLVLLARQWVACRADAEDVLQAAFVRFWKHRETARDPVAYLYSIVRTVAMNHHRSATRRRQHEHQAAGEPHRSEALFEDPADKVEQTELSESITRALESLPIEQREVVVMRTWGQLSFDAIGEAVGVPPRTAQSRYRYGIESMRRFVATTTGVTP